MNWKSREITDEYQIFYNKASGKLFALGLTWIVVIVSFFGFQLASGGALLKIIMSLSMFACGIFSTFAFLPSVNTYIKITKDKLVYRFGNASSEQFIDINDIESIGGTEYDQKLFSFPVLKKNKERVDLPLTGYEKQIIELLNIHTKYESSILVSNYIFLIIPAAVVIIAILVAAINWFHF